MNSFPAPKRTKKADVRQRVKQGINAVHDSLSDLLDEIQFLQAGPLNEEALRSALATAAERSVFGDIDSFVEQVISNYREPVLHPLSEASALIRVRKTIRSERLSRALVALGCWIVLDPNSEFQPSQEEIAQRICDEYNERQG